MVNLISSKKNEDVKYNVSIFRDYANSRMKITGYPHEKEMLKQIINYAARLNLGKIICNCRIQDIEAFEQCGFIEEGHIDGFYNGEDAICMSYFINEKRQISKQAQKKDAIIFDCINSQNNLVLGIDKSISIRDAQIEDIPQMISLFKDIFATYPSPVFDIDYLKNSMKTKTMFKVAELDHKIISIASAEMDLKNNNAEITDCATNPEFRGKGLLTNLIAELEKSLKQKHFKTLYSLSRATEPGINKALWKMHYKYSGRLINNCDISGGFEDMNIWVKKHMGTVLLCLCP